MGDSGRGRGRGKSRGGGRGMWGASKTEGTVDSAGDGFWSYSNSVGNGALGRGGGRASKTEGTVDSAGDGFWSYSNSVGNGALGRGGGRGTSAGRETLPRGAGRGSGLGSRASQQGAGRGRGQSKLTAQEARQGERKFAEACVKIQESVNRYIEHHNLMHDSDEDQDEEDLEEGPIFDRVYKSYGGHGGEGRTHQYLQEAVKGGTLICLICIDSIKRLDPVWNCGECYSSFHVQCVQKWAKDSIFQLSEAQADSSLSQKMVQSGLHWCCPKCRCEYSQTAIPTRYLCYCGKKVDPEFDPWLPPHSCGEVCNRKLKPDCGHSCLLLCHPGPCPPCPKNVNNSCHCGQQPPKTRRCSAKTWSCGQPCGRILSCGQHSCQDFCHPGECSPCPRKSRQPCSCGGSTQLRECAQPVWHCDKVCNKQHSCGHHRCQQVCHQGECGQCPGSGLRSCPCGKTSHSLPCTQDIPSCGDTCGKQLACGVHQCAERCHKGACPMCLQFREKRCRCGARVKETACSKELTCDLKCKKPRDCGRHTCSRKCCAGECPRCEQVCGRPLGCRSHRCESRCHQGPCYPCSLRHTLACRCGKTTLTVPCGRQKTTRPPKCSHPCRLPPDCHHPERKKHNCHMGSCPQCRIVCGLQLPCQHLCPHPCHHAVPVKVVNNKKRAGPWEPVVAPHIEIQKQPCPPCQVPIPTTCFGRHETPDWPCSEVRPYSCGRKCGRELACTNHTCQRECHVVEGAPDSLKAGSTCAPCEALCSKVRPEGCSHECGRPCHPGKCYQCQVLVKVRCHCNITVLYLQCHPWTTSGKEVREVMQSCKNQCNKLVSCGHRCTRECHSGPCSLPEECHKRVTIRCPCKRQRKEPPCHLVMAGQAKLLCDSVCAAKLEEKKKAQEEEEKKKLEEEQAKQKKEVEEFERKIEGRKHRKRNRRHVEEEVEESLWQRQRWLLLGVAVMVALAGVAVFLFLPRH